MECPYCTTRAVAMILCCNIQLLWYCVATCSCYGIVLQHAVAMVLCCNMQLLWYCVATCSCYGIVLQHAVAMVLCCNMQLVLLRVLRLVIFNIFIYFSVVIFIIVVSYDNACLLFVTILSIKRLYFHPSAINTHAQ